MALTSSFAGSYKIEVPIDYAEPTIAFDITFADEWGNEWFDSFVVPLGGS